jgi:hypothetical protein
MNADSVDESRVTISEHQSLLETQTSTKFKKDRA